MLLAGDVDPTFGIQVTTDFGLRGDVALDVAQQPDGKLVVVGYSRDADQTDRDISLARYLPDGALDANFGNGASKTDGPLKVLAGGGRITLSYNDPVAPAVEEADRGDQSQRVAVQSDGKIVVSAAIDGMVTLIRFNPDGSLDTSFDGDGLAAMQDYSDQTTTIWENRTDLALLSDAGGNTTGYLLSATRELFVPPEIHDEFDQDWVLAKYTLSGQLDPTFGGGTGRVITDFNGAGFAGETNSWDETFAITLLPDGRIVQAGGNEVRRRTGNFRNAISFVRFDANGNVDSTFGGTRYVRSFERSVLPGAGVAGQTTIEFGQKAPQPNDPNTPENESDTLWTKPFVTITGMTAGPGGSILATGPELNRTRPDAPDKNKSQVLVFKLDPSGDLDATFSADGIYEGLPSNGRPNQQDEPTTILYRPADDRIVVIGKSGQSELVGAPGQFLVLQLNPDGSPDTVFGTDGARFYTAGATIGRFNGALIDAAGKLVAVGQSGQDFEPVNSDFVVGRFNPDGSLDTTFGADNSAVPEMIVLATLVQPDGRILTAGYTGSIEANTARAVVARYTADGAPDPTFAANQSTDKIGTATNVFATTGATSAVAHAVAVGPDGSVYVTGSVGDDLAVARLTSAGMPNVAFGQDGVNLFGINAVDAGYGIAVLPDGKAIIAGASDGDWVLLKLLATGSADSSFDGDGLVTHDRGSTEDAAVTPLVLPDGKVLVSGTSRSATAAERVITLVRFNAGGSVDNTFAGGAGLVTGLTTARLGVDDDPFNRLDGQGVAVDAAGHIVVAGASGDDAGVARYTPDGAADPSFGTGGRATFDWGGVDDPDSVAFGDGGQVLLAGTVNSASEATTGAVVAAVTPDGARRAAFGDNGVLRLESQASEGLGRTFRSGGTTRASRASSQGGALVVAARKEVGGLGRSTVRRIVAADDQGPAAALTPIPQVFVPDATTQSFEVVYSDDVAIDFTTIDTADVTVTSPGGVIPVSSVQILNPSNGSPRSAIYTIAAPGGAFDAADNGTYSIALVPGAVADTSGNAAAGEALGVFVVDIQPTDPAGPNFNLAFTRPITGSLVGGAKGRAAASVTNTGAGDATQPMGVVLYLSTDTVVDGTDRPLATGQVRKPLKLGRRASVKFNRFNFPSDLLPGNYHVLARVDDANANTENAETDNVFDGGTIALTPPTMDAVPVSLSTIKVKPGKASVTLLVRNDGNVQIKGNITGGLFASADGAIDGADTSLGTYTVRGSIKPGATKRLKVKFTPPAGLSSFTLIVTADAPADPTPGQFVSAPAAT